MMNSAPLDPRAGIPAPLAALMDDHFPERLAIMATHLYSVLAAADDLRPLGEARLAELVLDQVDRYSAEEGGSSFYVMKGLRFRLSQRDRRIVDEFTGNNIEQLAAKHGLSDMRIRQILAAARAEHIARNQGRLDLEAPADSGGGHS
jgi:Mor family transcriptional regulator